MGTFFTPDLETAKLAHYHHILGPSMLIEAKIIDSVSRWTGLSRDAGRTELL